MSTSGLYENDDRYVYAESWLEDYHAYIIVIQYLHIHVYGLKNLIYWREDGDLMDGEEGGICHIRHHLS